MHTSMKVRINWSELAPALYGLGWQVVVVVLIAVLMPRLRATVDEVIAVVVACVAVIGAQAVIHLIVAYVRMSLLLNRVAPSGSGEQAEVRAGELLAEMNQRGERERQGGDRGNQHVEAKSQPATLPKLSDLGVTESQSSRWQQLVVAAPSDNTGRKLTD